MSFPTLDHPMVSNTVPCFFNFLYKILVNNVDTMCNVSSIIFL